MDGIGKHRTTPESGISAWSEPYWVPPASSQGPMFTWEQAVRVLRKRGRFIVTLAGLATLGVIAYSLSIKNEYQPTARIEIDPLESGIRTLQEIEYSNGSADVEYLQTQAQILQSDALAMRVVRALHLDARPDFLSGGPREARQSATRPLAARDVRETSTGLLNEQFNLVERTPRESLALELLEHNLSISPLRNSRLIEVSYVSNDPALAQLITNTVVTQFIEQNYRNRYNSTMEASEWLSAQLNDLRQKVRDSSQAVANYQERHGLVEADERDDPQSQLMAEVNHQLGSAQADRIEAEAYARMVDAGHADSLPALREDQVYQNLLTRFSDVRAQLAEASTVYGDENTNVKKLQSEAGELDAQIQAERERASSRILASFNTARAREQMLSQSRDKLMTAMGNASSHVLQFELLKNEAKANEELYNTLQGRLKEAGIYAGLRSSNIRVIDLAPKLVSPTGPHRRFIVTIGSLAGIFLAIAMAFVWESLENTIRTPDDLKECAGLASLAMLPTIEGAGIRRERSLPLGLQGETHRPLGPARAWWNTVQQLSESEGMRGLGTSLSVLCAQSDQPPRIVLVCSSLQGEGKSTIAVNLAAAFARRGRTCLLIDADLRRPRIAEAFGVKAEPGLTEVLSGAVGADHAIVNSGHIPGLSILPSGRTEMDPATLLNVESVRSLLDEMKNKFDAIVIDSPPVIPFSDARLLAHASDAVILVSRYGFTTRRAISRGTQLMEEVGARIAGVVLNGIDLKSADYHYYNYGFSRQLIHSADYASPPRRGGARQGREEGDGSDGSNEKPKSKGARA